MSNGTPQPTQDILLDTCILQYSGNTDSSAVFLDYLKDIGTRKFGLAISKFTVYELLQGASVTKEVRLATLLNRFRSFSVSHDTLVAAAQLKTLYNAEKIPDSQISDGDKIIAATAILTGSLIITADARDFPLPFFTQAEVRHLTFSKSGRPVMIPTYILSPDMAVIKDRFSNRPRT